MHLQGPLVHVLLSLTSSAVAAPRVSVHRIEGSVGAVEPITTTARSDTDLLCNWPDHGRPTVPIHVKTYCLPVQEIFNIDPTTLRKHTTVYSTGTIGAGRHHKRTQRNTRRDVEVTNNSRSTPGHDPLALHNEPVWPFIAVGKVFKTDSKNTKWGYTGTLVGPRHVLVDDNVASSFASGYFVPGYDNPGGTDGERFGRSEVEAVVRLSIQDNPTSNCRRKHNLAILILKDRIGEKVGYIGTIRNANKAHLASQSHKLVTLGYPLSPAYGSYDKVEFLGGQRPMRRIGISGLADQSSDCRPSSPIRTNSDYGKGAGRMPFAIDGMPLWEQEDGSETRWISGIFFGYHANSKGPGYATAFASGRALPAIVAYAKEKWP